jgi:ATP-dependent Clp protease ATP-binding subunit ClpA
VTFERFDQDARRRVMALAAEESRRRGDERIGTEHLLLALLRDPGSMARRALGVDVDRARAALDDLDLEALRAVGIDLPSMGRSVPVLTRRRPPFTSGAREVFHRAVLVARSEGARRIRARHLLLGVLARSRPDPAAELLNALGVDAAQVRELLSRPSPRGGGT